MSKVLKQLFKEDLEQAENRTPQLRLVPPPPPPPDFILKLKRIGRKAKPKKKRVVARKIPHWLWMLPFFSFLGAGGLFFVLSLQEPAQVKKSVKVRKTKVTEPAASPNPKATASPGATATTTPAAIQAIKKSELPKDLPDAKMHQEAVNFLRKQKYEQAQALLVKLAKDHPENPVILSNLGLAKLRLNDAKGAKNDFMKSMGLLTPKNYFDKNPQLAVVYNNLGSVSLAEKNWGPAILYFQKATEIQADFIEARLNLGRAYELSGRHEEAAQEYENFVKDPKVNASMKPVIQKRLEKLKIFIGYLEELESEEETETDY
jgi:tetratricopeptide (TPR) repeat protein